MILYIEILERKNLCLRNFYFLCEKFLADISKGNLDGLEDFQRRRQGLVHVLESLEAESSKILSSYNSNPHFCDADLAEGEKEKITHLIRSKDSTIKSIVDLDLQILDYIDKAKNETIRKLTSIQSGKKSVIAYRSPLEAVERSEGNTIIDQEA